MTPERRLLLQDKANQIERENTYGVFLWFVDGIISDAIDSREMRDGEADPQTVYSSLRNAKNLAREQLGISSRSKFRSFGSELVNYQDSQAYRRLGQICNDDPERRLNATLKTVTYIIPKVLETIPRLVPEATPEDLFLIANESKSFVDKLGENEGNYFNSAINLLSGQDMYEPGFNESAPWRTDGILVIDRNGLDFSDKIKQKFTLGNIRTLGGNHLLDRSNNRSVLWNGSDKSSVRRLHSWFVNQVAPSYEQSRR